MYFHTLRRPEANLTNILVLFYIVCLHCDPISDTEEEYMGIGSPELWRLNPAFVAQGKKKTLLHPIFFEDMGADF